MNQSKRDDMQHRGRIIIMIHRDGTAVPWVYPHHWVGVDVMEWLHGPGSWVELVDLRDGLGPRRVDRGGAE